MPIRVNSYEPWGAMPSSNAKLVVGLVENEYYMLRPELWRKVCRFNDMLCIGCVEDRLGRMLVPTDFKLEETFARAMQFPPSHRLKQRLGISWDKRLTRVLAS